MRPLRRWGCIVWWCTYPASIWFYAMACVWVGWRRYGWGVAYPELLVATFGSVAVVGLMIGLGGETIIWGEEAGKGPVAGMIQRVGGRVLDRIWPCEVEGRDSV